MRSGPEEEHSGLEEEHSGLEVGRSGLEEHAWRVAEGTPVEDSAQGLEEDTLEEEDSSLGNKIGGEFCYLLAL